MNTKENATEKTDVEIKAKIEKGVALEGHEADKVHKTEFLQTKKLHVLADGIVRATAKVGKLYLDLCVFIRTNQVAPKLVSHVLTERGFARSRISEINAVANAADDVWNKFEAGTIGFRKVLELGRGNVIDIVAETLGEAKNDAVEALSLGEGGEGGEGGERGEGGEGGERGEGGDSKGNTSGDGVETDARTFERTCVQLFKLAERLGYRKRTVKGAKGYTLVLSYNRAFGKKKEAASKEVDAK